MNVYIATKLDNDKNHNLLRDELKKHGISLSYDWTIVDNDDRSNKAVNELGGIRYADLVVVLLPGGRGTHVEFGYALALNKPIIVFGPDEQIWGEEGECIFFALTRVSDRGYIIRVSDRGHRFESDVRRLAALISQRVTIAKEGAKEKSREDRDNMKGRWLGQSGWFDTTS